ncbi:MAG: DUF479 domain-containing protein [Bacteroidetes bacterium]|nr:MAG: DUF479 domain-containing protein [Bacteroidota bacterium]REJ99681.1 MAG: DUF479 domain-containing protein [Bacteroidota bacterium]REK33914.1 MAG: DUF479 domain-containing protein [Bacteroidota bacterium]REK47679.1 MAG: DUF479 domain-containing protein [Bacteroidota bacterium]
MNFLAHTLLSGDDVDLMIGNFIADYVKGNKKDHYPEPIRKGIILHRYIDDFTDHHPVQLKSRHRLFERHGHYSGVLVDLFYDHFIAKNFHEFSSVSLEEFTTRTYNLLIQNAEFLPERVKEFLPFMIEKNWMLSYESLEGLDRALKGLSRRVSFENRMDTAILDLKQGYKLFEADFRAFWPQLRTFVDSQLK